MPAFRHFSARASWLLMLALLAPLAGCAAGTLDSMWREPGYDAPDMQNILVIGLRPDPLRRRLWEDAFVNALTARGCKATASYSIWTASTPDTAQVIAAVRENGYDGVLVAMRLPDHVAKSTQPGYVRREAVTEQNPWTGQYHTYWKDIEVPEKTTEESVGNFQTDVWATANGGRLVWSGNDLTINSIDPRFIRTRVEKMWVPEIAKSGIFPPVAK